jgi:hypothetical protein
MLEARDKQYKICWFLAWFIFNLKTEVTCFSETLVGFQRPYGIQLKQVLQLQHTYSWYSCNLFISVSCPIWLPVSVRTQIILTQEFRDLLCPSRQTQRILLARIASPFFLFTLVWNRVHYYRAYYWPILPAKDDDVWLWVCWMIGRGSISTRRKPAPVPLWPPQIPHDLTCSQAWAAVVGNQQLTAWATAWPLPSVTSFRSIRGCTFEVTRCPVELQRNKPAGYSEVGWWITSSCTVRPNTCIPHSVQ